MLLLVSSFSGKGMQRVCVEFQVQIPIGTKIYYRKEKKSPNCAHATLNASFFCVLANVLLLLHSFTDPLNCSDKA